MKKSILATAVALSAGLFASTAMAVLPPIEMTGSTINFSGNLVPAACEVSLASQDMTVNLGVVDLDQIQAETGPTFNLQPFDITFENCDSSIASTFDVAFTAASLSTTTDYVAYNESVDSPSSAGLQLQTAPGTFLPMNGTAVPASRVNVTDGSVVVSYIPAYTDMVLTVPGAVTAGNTLYNMTYKVIYQ